MSVIYIRGKQATFLADISKKHDRVVLYFILRIYTQIDMIPAILDETEI